jgi:exodeoxyribonuclease VII small subunit
LLDVANAPKDAGANVPQNAADLPFEQALKRLESIVEAMESEDLPLEKLLAHYQEGTSLARVCQQRLAEAELKIQRLEETANGELRLKTAILDKQDNNVAGES